jgi:hypothetical protein
MDLDELLEALRLERDEHHRQSVLHARDRELIDARIRGIEEARAALGAQTPYVQEVGEDRGNGKKPRQQKRNIKALVGDLLADRPALDDWSIARELGCRLKQVEKARLALSIEKTAEALAGDE